MSHDSEPQPISPIALSLDDFHFVENASQDVLRLSHGNAPVQDINEFVSRTVFGVVQNPQISEALLLAVLGFSMGSTTDPEVYTGM